MGRNFAQFVVGLWVTVCCLPAPARADHALRIAGPSIEGVFELGKPGPYWNFYVDIASHSPVEVELYMLPVKRFTRAFFRHEHDCIYMASDDEIFYEENGKPLTDFLYTPAFSRINLHAYTALSAPVIHSRAKMEGKAIAGDEGLHVSSIVQRRLPFAKSILYAKTVDDAFSLIVSGRAQVVVAYSIDAAQYFDRAGETSFHTDPDFVLMSLGEGMTCWPSADAEVFIAYASERIKALNASGELKTRFGFMRE
ncbi:type 2 periplasmic-binding domain-containing protein [Kordiimonas aestuarii]|uniref:hypothetical protein n=1 Tax=Kordiimonas aestuarii TaxID=1005925 RepID=UPI0021D07861|nr:hypothetical protein [Kordiimonas aestuarii]